MGIIPRRFLGEESQVCLTVFVRIKDIYGANTALANMMWIVRDNNTKNSNHAGHIMEFYV